MKCMGTIYSLGIGMIFFLQKCVDSISEIVYIPSPPQIQWSSNYMKL